MTIQELIGELNKIEDKSLKVFLDGDFDVEEFDGEFEIIEIRNWSATPSQMINVLLLK